MSRAHLEDAIPDLADAVACGLRLKGMCKPLLAQRWEEGWTIRGQTSDRTCDIQACAIPLAPASAATA